MIFLIKKIIAHLLFWTPFIAFTTVGLFSFLSGAVIFGTQVFNWLKGGIWTPSPLFEVTPQFILSWVENINWLGIKKILVWFLVKLPSSVSLAISGLIVYGIGYGISCAMVEDLEEKWKIKVYNPHRQE